MNRSHGPQLTSLASIGLVLAVSLAGCHGGGSSTSGQFTPSMTAPSPGVVKLAQKTRSGARVVIDVLIFGPEPALDLSAFKFGIRIGNTELARFVTQDVYTQSALVADAGQAITIDVDGTSDPATVKVDVEKLGGGAGNGFASPSAVVIEVSFDLQGSGTTTLTLVGLNNNPAQALDSNGVAIDAVDFDAASAGLTGVTTGGGGY